MRDPADMPPVSGIVLHLDRRETEQFAMATAVEWGPVRYGDMSMPRDVVDQAVLGSRGGI